MVVNMSTDIIKVAKSLKRSMVEITPYYICGSDYPLLSTFSIIYPNGNITIPNDTFWFGPTTELGNDEDHVRMEEMWVTYHKPKMDYLRASVLNMETQPPICHIQDIKSGCDITGFMESISQKAKYGAKLLNIDFTNFFITSCSMIHPINKSDSVELILYPYDEISFLSKFIIKKKKYTINEYIRFLYLQEKANEQIRV